MLLDMLTRRLEVGGVRSLALFARALAHSQDCRKDMRRRVPARETQGIICALVARSLPVKTLYCVFLAYAPISSSN